jgi:hypothetical protein
MGLADQLAEMEPSRRASPGEPNAVERVLAALDDTDRAALDAKLRNRRFPATRLAAILTEHGYPISHSTISSWRADHVPR